LGERSILPPGLKEKMRLTDEQRAELKPIEADFANTSRQYQIANQPRIEAALDVSRQARESKDTARIEAARRQLQQVWAGLQPYREAAVKQIRPVLTPDQITNDPSAN
jgi:vacuolar-type H+-ATPase subunit E/Vma4